MTFFLLYKEHHGFGMKEEKFETDPKRREHHEFWTKRYLILIRSVDFFIFYIFLENSMILGQKLVFVLKSQTIFCPICKVGYYILIA